MSNKKVYFKTFGCRTNIFDTQVMMHSLKAYEVTQEESEADVVVVNSCTVTNGADGDVRCYINQLEKKGTKVLLTGCGAHSKGEDLYNDSKVFGVFGQSEKRRVEEFLDSKKHFFEKGTLDFVDEMIVEDFVGRSRAFIKIQEGCSFRCNYCIIPFVRGDSRSMSEEKILEQIRILCGRGFSEFILTGTNTGSYGQNEGRNIASLMTRIANIDGVKRLRVGSLEPIQINSAFKEILDEPWLERHLHIALQHTSNEMLKLMNRRNRYESDEALLHFLADKGFALGTDIILGHPGESEALWNEALVHYKTLPLTHLHAFTYSKRDGTPSASMTNSVRGDVAKERLKQLQVITQEKNLAFRQKHRVVLDVLIESHKENRYSGFDQFFNKVILHSSKEIDKKWVQLSDYAIEKEANIAQL